MRLKKFSSFVFIFSLFITSALTAQPYAQVNVGYGFKMNSQSAVSASTDARVSSPTTTYTVSRFSLGAGLNFGVGGGYMLTPNLGAGLDLGFLMGAAAPVITDNTQKTAYMVTHEEHWGTAFQFRLIPNLLLTTANDNGMNIYGRLGLVVGLGTRFDLSTHDEDPDPTAPLTRDKTVRFSGGMPLGLMSAMGVSYAFSDKLSGFGELNLVAMNYTPAKAVATKYMVNGTDQFSALQPYDKETDFKDSYTDPGGKIDKNLVRVESAVTYPFSSVGINVGVRMKF